MTQTPAIETQGLTKRFGEFTAVADLDLRVETGLSMLFITHNLGVVACVADSVLVMDKGELCETGPVSRVLEHPEHEYTRTSSIVVGLATASPSAEARPFVRPVSDALDGHFHAAVTSFRSLPRGKVELAEVVTQAFQSRSLLSVVHLLHDTRPVEGAGESEFHRGACWLFPLASVRDGDGT